MPPSSLYHYTDFESLKLILSEERVLLNSANDIRCAHYETYPLFAELYHAFLSNIDLCYSLYVTYSNRPKDKKLFNEKDVLDFIKILVKERENSYIFCLSDNFSNQELFDNRNETNEAVIIEFDLPIPVIPILIGGSDDRSDEITLFQMRYFSGMSDLQQYVAGILQQGHGLNKTKTGMSFLLDMFKLTAFSAEQEYRLLFYLSTSKEKLNKAYGKRFLSDFLDMDKSKSIKRYPSIYYDRDKLKIFMDITYENHDGSIDSFVKRVYFKNSELHEKIDKIKRTPKIELRLI